MSRRTIQYLFKLPEFDDEETKRKARRLYAIALAGIILTLIYCVSWLATVPREMLRVLLFVIPVLLAYVVTLVLIHRKYIQAAITLFLVAFMVIVTAIVFTSGGTRAPFFSFYTLLVIVAALFIGKRAAIYVAIASLILGIGMVYLDSLGLINQPFATPMSAWITQAASMFFVSLGAYIVVEDTRNAFLRVQVELKERERAEKAAQESEKRHRVVLELISDYAYGFDVSPDGEMIPSWITEDSFMRLTGYKWNEIEGTFDLYTPEDAIVAQRHAQETIKGAKTDGEYRIVTKDGQVKWVYLRRHPVWSEAENRVVHIYGVAQDITERKQTEVALRLSEERYRLISDVGSDYVFTTQLGADGVLHLTWIGGAFETITGYSFEEYVAKGGWVATLHPDDREQDSRDMATLRANQRVITEIRTIHKSGAILWVRVYAHPVWDAERNMLVGIFGAVQDITERKNTEQELQTERRLLRDLIDHLPDLVFIKDVEGRFVVSNDAHTQIIGCTREEDVLGKTTTDFAPPELAQAYLRDDQQVILSGESILNREEQIQDSHGESRWFLTTKIPLRDHNGAVTGVIGLSHDITRRKQTEDALRKSEDRYWRAIEAADGIPYLFDYATNSVRFDGDGIQKLTGYSRDEISHEIWVSLIEKTFPLGDAAKYPFDEAVRRSRSGEFPVWRCDYRIHTRDGQMRWVAQSAVEVIGPSGISTGSIGMFQDITERKQIEEALRHSEALLRALLDTTTDVAFLMSRDGTLLTLNKAMADSVNKTVEALTGRNGFDLLPPQMTVERRKQFDLVIQTREPLRWEDFGTTRWWDNSIYPVLSPSGEVEAFAVYSRNVSERKHLEAELLRYTSQLEQMVETRTAELRHAKEQLEIILHNTSDALALAKPNGDVETANPAFLATFDERVAHSIENILWLLANEKQVDLVSDALLAAIYNSESKRIETQIIANGKHERDIDLVLTPVRTANDDLRHGVLVSARDITHLKEIERFKSRFVADAVHDLATPIAGLTTRIYLLKRNPERIAEHLRALENQVEHLRSLLDDLRTLSQLDRGQILLERLPLNINEVVQRVFDTYEPVANNKHQTLLLKADSSIPMALLDQGQIERVIVNLVSNAVNYTPDNKTIRISTAVHDGQIWVQIVDEGIGISAEDLPHVFDRFYRGSEARQSLAGGTGLGLAIVKEVIELHGGTINVTSEVGRGSTFNMLLPLT